MREVNIRKITARDQPRQKVRKTLSQPISQAWWGHACNPSYKGGRESRSEASPRQRYKILPEK
jgi:hypothetical protein